MAPYINLAQDVAAHISRLSRVPITYFLSNVSNLGGDALALLISGLVLKCQRRVTGYEPAIEGAARLALRTMGDPRANIANIEVKWADMETRSPAQSADAAVKLTQGDNPVITPETAQEKYLGMAQTERNRDALRATTIAAIKTAAANGIAADIAMANGLTQASGAVARLVLDGGRETFMGTIQNDSAASGWQRVLGGAGCDFCAMLADRGAVYKEDTADFASHDHCGCSAEPSYGGSPRTVKAYVPSAKNIPDADRARVRAYLRDHPRA
jgi:hypothetical protein